MIPAFASRHSYKEQRRETTKTQTDLSINLGDTKQKVPVMEYSTLPVSEQEKTKKVWHRTQENPLCFVERISTCTTVREWIEVDTILKNVGSRSQMRLKIKILQCSSAPACNSTLAVSFYDLQALSMKHIHLGCDQMGLLHEQVMLGETAPQWGQYYHTAWCFFRVPLQVADITTRSHLKALCKDMITLGHAVWSSTFPIRCTRLT